MTCRDIEQNLPAYLEDLLPEEEKDLIREHLASCRKCGKALEDLQRMELLLQNLEEVTPPPWLKQKILAQVKEGVHAEKGFFKKLFNPVYFKIPLQTVALLVITVLAFYLYRGEGPELKKEGVDIVPPAAILQQQQSSEKREPFRMAPAQSASTQMESLEKSDKSVAAPSRYTRREPAPPPQKSPLREEIRPESVQPAQPADGAVVALKKEFPPEAEEWEKREKRKEKRLAGDQDSAKPGLQEHKIDEAQLKAQPHEFSVASRSMERDVEGGATFPLRQSAPSTGIGNRDSKAESAATETAQVRDRHKKVEEIRILLRQYDAQKIESSVSGEKEILTAILPSRQVKTFLQKLEARDDTGTSVSVGTADAKQGTVEIRIEILRKP
ncbi:anti-sigma factor [Syntrophus aciditrophicus]|uniref:Hypothetical membrane protein n=1 Tax=Syntrophus aciditrophicus (strain SB) TaxID=56780 RepID=Q2LQI2_SYNAS|nr:zf-HC2 domain-containing protein [Syntrophus aciditrophicus]ABC75894.1 hypothetical membrane protein [Syntrophus aciditrophicus SB]